MERRAYLPHIMGLAQLVILALGLPFTAGKVQKRSQLLVCSTVTLKNDKFDVPVC
jgi:hypothetical protein